MIPHAFEKKEDEISIVSAYDLDKELKPKWYDWILQNRLLKVISVLAIVSIMAPLLIYRFVFYTSAELAPPDGHSFGSCLIPRASRMPCGIGNVPESECHKQCCYDLLNNVCYHRFPSRFSYLILTNANWTEETVMTPRIPTVPFSQQTPVLGVKLSISEISRSHLSLTFYDSRDEPLNGSRIEEKDYDYTILSPELSIIVNSTVNQNSTSPIFNTMRGPIIASDNIWEITFKLTEQSMYGMGELPLKPGTVKVIYSHEGGVGPIPLIFARTNESYHGVLIDADAPTEVSIRENNQILVRSITKTGLKLHLFTGPEPKDIMRDVLSVTGNQAMLNYRMLGAHVCSEVMPDDVEALSHLTTFITNATRDGFPFESHCGIRPLVFDAEPVASPQVVSGMAALTTARKLFVPHISPYIRYTEDQLKNDTMESNETIPCTNMVCNFKDMMLRFPNTESVTLYTGTAHDDMVVYPDYGHENITELLDSLWAYSMSMDGAILENNWPLDDSTKAHNETDLPYFSEDIENAFDNTPQWNVTSSDGTYHLYDHNKYGNHFLDAFRRKFDEAASLPTWSSSQWMRADAVVNRQSITTSWLSLRQELVAAAVGGVSGNWLWSSPICGDTENIDMETQASLCVKWYLAGTYLPMIKIHSKSVMRHPLAFQGTQSSIMIDALNKRMMLMPYFNTVLQEGPLLRPMFYQFPFSEDLVDLSSQFSVGDELLIVPNLQPFQSHVHVRMPPGIWYEFWSGQRIGAEENEVVPLTTTEADFVTLIRGGSIVPIQKIVRADVTTMRLQSPFNLKIAVERVNITSADDEVSEHYQAAGKLQVSANWTIHFSVTDNQLTMSAVGDDPTPMCGTNAQLVWVRMLDGIDVYGLPEELNNFDHHLSVPNVWINNLCNLRTQNIVQTLY